MSRIFLSHHNSNNQEAQALKLWLESQGWRDEIFLDSDPGAGIQAGTRWKEALKQAVTRCEAVVCLTSPEWVGSPECEAEYRTAENLHKKIFVAQIAELNSASKGKKSRNKPDNVLDRTSEWQRCQLYGEGPFTEISLGPGRNPVQFATEGLTRLKLGLLEAGISGVLPKHFPWPPADDPKREPYRGLRPLEFQDAGVYFGRNAEILTGLAKLHRMRLAGAVPLFVILGASGTGKSSFLRAGLLPRLKNEDRQFFALNVVRPQKEPLFGDSGLAQVIALANAELKLTPVDQGDVESELKTGPGACSELLQKIQQAAQTRVGTSADPSFPPTIILPVDQAEELFNADAAEEARTFLEMIGAVLRGEAAGKRIQRVSLIVAFTIRSDRYEPLQTAPELKDIERELFDDLRPMPPAQFREVITGPASRAFVDGRQLEVEEALVDRLVSDCTDGADTLPLLGLILDKLYRKYGNDGKLELREFLEMGELAKVIRTEAESILSSDQDTRQAQLAQLQGAFFPYLVRINPDNNQPMRRVARMADLPQDSRPLIQALIEKRLLLSDLRNDEQVVEVAHESLFRHWKVLSDWLDEERDDLKEADRLEEEANGWADKGKKGKKEDYLRRGERLSIGEALAAKPTYRRRLESVSEFLMASRQVEERRREEKEQAVKQLQQAVDNNIVQRLAAQADTALSSDPPDAPLALALAIEALQISLKKGELVVPAAEQSIRTALSRIASSGHKANTECTVSVDEEEASSHLWSLLSKSPAPAFIDLLKGYEHESGEGGVAFSTDGAWLASRKGKTIRLWALKAGPGAVVDLPNPVVYGGVYDLAFSHDGRRLVAASGAAQYVWLWDATSGELLSLEHGADSNAVAFSSNGRWLASGGWSGSILLWDLSKFAQFFRATEHSKALDWTDKRNCAPTKPITVGKDNGRILHSRTPLGDIKSVAFSHDYSKLAVAGEGGRVLIWDVTDEVSANDPIALPHTHEALGVAISSSGLVATVGSDGSVKLWDMLSRNPTETHVALSGHIGDVSAVAFSPDGRRLATAGADGKIRLWDLKAQDTTASCVLLEGHKEAILRIAFSPDGRWLATNSQDGNVRLWLLNVGELMGLASIFGRNLSLAEWPRYFYNTEYRRTFPSLEVPPDPQQPYKRIVSGP